MKKLLIIILLAETNAFAATLSVDIPTGEIPRLTEAYGSILNLGRDATQAEIEQAVRQWLIQSTHDYERRKNMQQFVPTPIP